MRLDQNLTTEFLLSLVRSGHLCWIAHQIRAAFRWMDTVDVEELFKTKAAVLRSVPHFLRGSFRVALHTTLAEATATEHAASTGVEFVSLDVVE